MRSFFLPVIWAFALYRAAVRCTWFAMLKKLLLLTVVEK
jgi:hypothetical protein